MKLQYLTGAPPLTFLRNTDALINISPFMRYAVVFSLKLNETQCLPSLISTVSRAFSFEVLTSTALFALSGIICGGTKSSAIFTS